MPFAQTTYLVMVISGFCLFGLGLAWASWWSRGPATPRASSRRGAPG